MSRFRILIVCTGNVHRSALAAVLLECWATWYLPASVASDVDIASAGTRAVVGAQIGDYPRAIADALGGSPEGHRARSLTDDDIAKADLVLAASRSHRDHILRRVPGALRRTFTIREAARTAELLSRPPVMSTDELRRVVAMLADQRRPAANPHDDDVIDPQGQDADAYARMALEEVPALAALASVLFGMPQADLVAYREAAADPALLTGELRRR